MSSRTGTLAVAAATLSDRNIAALLAYADSLITVAVVLASAPNVGGYACAGSRAEASTSTCAITRDALRACLA